LISQSQGVGAVSTNTVSGIMGEGHLNIGAADLGPVLVKELIVEKGMAITTTTIIIVGVVLEIVGDQDPTIRIQKTVKMTHEQVASTIKDKNRRKKLLESWWHYVE